MEDEWNFDDFDAPQKQVVQNKAAPRIKSKPKPTTSNDWDFDDFGIDKPVSKPSQSKNYGFGNTNKPQTSFKPQSKPSTNYGTKKIVA